MTTIQNHITLIGNIGTDTRVVNFENGSKLARFHVFIEKQFRANNGKIRFGKEWHTIFAIGNLAKYIESFAEKGKKVAIVRTWTNNLGQWTLSPIRCAPVPLQWKHQYVALTIPLDEITILPWAWAHQQKHPSKPLRSGCYSMQPINRPHGLLLHVKY